MHRQTMNYYPKKSTNKINFHFLSVLIYFFCHSILMYGLTVQKFIEEEKNQFDAQFIIRRIRLWALLSKIIIILHI